MSEPKIVAECWTCKRAHYKNDCLSCLFGAPLDAKGQHVTRLSAAGLEFHNDRTVGHDVRPVEVKP